MIPQVFFSLQGLRYELNVRLPATVLDAKQLIHRRFGLPANVQSLFDYPSVPDHGQPGLRLFADNLLKRVCLAHT